MSIPKPGSLKARPALIRLHMLHEAMTETHATIQSFQDFKYWIQFYAGKMNPTKRKAQYSVEAWAKFLDKILSVQPELTFYEDYWPIEVYFDIYMGNRRGHWRRKNYNRGSQNSTMASEVSYDDNVENAGASSSKPSLNIRDTQQPVSRGPFPPGKSSNKYSADPFSNKVGTQSGRSTMTLSARSQSPGWRSINATASTSTTVHGRPTSGNSRVPVNLDASPRMSIRDHSKMEEKLIVACLACGITATVKNFP
ncbi:hypothetical protein BYT27DRAFT_6921977 [Phlegmacium glaucopus]|nr:hypothetical protein BYT27DRAFT_6921977 [Phlegmacium glaucopus]